MKTFCAKMLFLATLVAVMTTEAAAQSPSGVAPTRIPISGALQTATGAPRTGSVLLVLSLYDVKDDPAPRWIEHQVVTLDAAGNYQVEFGSTREDGLPPELFSGAAAAKWIGVAVENEAEQPRLMLTSVTYAAKAASADTLDGRAASDFVLTSDLTDQVKAVLQDGRAGEGDGPGTNAVTLNFLQKGDGGMGTTTDSSVYEAGGYVGIGTAAPDVRLSVIDPDATESRIELANAAGYLSSKKIFLALRPTSNYGLMQVYNYGGIGGMNLSINPSGGNVGVGTTAPDVKLSVVDGNTTESRIELGTAPGYASSKKIFLGLRPSANYGILQAYSYGGSGGMNMIINPSGGNVGVGTTSPTATLEVAGQLKMTGGSPGAGKVLTSDADGLATWTTAASGSQWTTSGSDIYYNTGNVGIGDTSSSSWRLDVRGAGDLGGVRATSDSQAGVQGTSNSNDGVQGISGSGNGVGGISNSGFGVGGTSSSSYGVYGTSTSSYAGYFEGNVHVTGTVTQGSDVRLKQGVRNLGYGLREVMQLRPVSWTWKKSADQRLQLGLIAQEVEGVVPALVTTTDAEQTKGLNYIALVPVVIKAIQEQQDTITSLNAENTTLKQQNATLGTRLTALEQAMRALLGHQQDQAHPREPEQ